MANIWNNSSSLSPTLSSLSAASKFQACVPSGLATNPVEQLATIILNNSPSGTGLTNIIPVNNGFVASITAVATAGSNILTSVSSSAALQNNQGIVESGSTNVYPVHIPPNARIASFSSANSTINMGKTVALASGAVTIYIVSNQINYIGAFPFRYNANGSQASFTAISAGSTFASNSSAIEFMTDAANFAAPSAGHILFQVQTQGITPNAFTIAIDDVAQSIAPITFATGASPYVGVVFDTPGIHKVRIDIPANMLFASLFNVTGSSIWAPPASPILCAMFSDSFFANGQGNTFTPSTIGQLIPLMLGWNYRNLSAGGTGYVANGSVNYNWASAQRINDFTYESYDVIVVQGSVNDNPFSAASITANALATFQGMRSKQPNAVILVFGCCATLTLSVASATAIENAVLSAFNSWNDTNSRFIPISTDSNGAWINSSNSSTYINAVDNTHPIIPVGTLYLAQLFVSKIRAVLGINPVPATNNPSETSTISGYGRVTAQAAANASIASLTVGTTDESFLVSANVLVTTSTLHSFTTTCTYTSEDNTSRTLTMSFSSVGGTVLTAIANAGGAAPYEGVPLAIRAKANTTITIGTTGTFTTVVYNAEGLIQRTN